VTKRPPPRLLPRLQGESGTAEFSFNEAYKGTPPWDIGRPQREFVRLADEGKIHGKVLDIGCGTGENALYFASLGMSVTGVDSSPRAIEKAKKKARTRGFSVDFKLGDALHLEKLGERFNTITDCGLFHVFSDQERVVYAKSLRSALSKGGTYFMLCFSTKEPTDWGGPRRVSEAEIRETFKKGWSLNFIREAKFSSTSNEEGGYAWLSSVTAT